MSTKQDMKLADVFWRLDALADSSVISEDASTAARDAVRALREATRMLGVDPAQGADGITAAIESIQMRYRQAQQNPTS